MRTVQEETDSGIGGGCREVVRQVGLRAAGWGLGSRAGEGEYDREECREGGKRCVAPC